MDAAKDQETGTWTCTTADAAPGLKPQSSTYPKFSDSPL